MPVMRAELVRYRRLLELARAQRDAILAGRFTDLPGILAERQAILHELSGPRSAGAGSHGAGDPAPVPQTPGGVPPASDDDGTDLSEEAREILRAILEVDRECRDLVWERLKQVEQDLAATRAALQGSRAYRLSLEASPVSRILDELK